MGNLTNWEKLARPPETALKAIKGGRLSGMTDISPMWRYKALTEVYGACGEGWKFSIEKLWTEAGTDGQIMAFAQISLFVKHGNAPSEWSDPIPGVGGSMLIAKESKGLHTSDEAFKMAITDALSTAAKMLGVGADIYMGLWDGSKYKTTDVADKVIAANVKPMAGAGEGLDEDQRKKAEETASKCLDWIQANSIADAVVEKENAFLDADQTIYFWSFFDSKQKTAMKNEFSKQKTERLNREAATQP